jgi:hypothetical protein
MKLTSFQRILIIVFTILNVALSLLVILWGAINLKFTSDFSRHCRPHHFDVLCESHFSITDLWPFALSLMIVAGTILVSREAFRADRNKTLTSSSGGWVFVTLSSVPVVAATILSIYQ